MLVGANIIFMSWNRSAILYRAASSISLKRKPFAFDPLQNGGLGNTTLLIWFHESKYMQHATFYMYLLFYQSMD